MFIVGGIDKESILCDKPINQLNEEILIQSLKRAQIDINTCYVTSIIKCGTLKDKKDNIIVCMDWLRQEIDILKPKVLVFIGNATFKAFNKQYGNIGIKTVTEEYTLYGMFSRNSQMMQFVDKLKEIKCHLEKTYQEEKKQNNS